MLNKNCLRDKFTPVYAELRCLFPAYLHSFHTQNTFRADDRPSRGGGRLGCLRLRLPEAAGRLFTSLCVFVLLMQHGSVCSYAPDSKNTLLYISHDLVMLRVPTGYDLSAAWPDSWSGQTEEFPAVIPESRTIAIIHYT